MKGVEVLKIYKRKVKSSRGMKVSLMMPVGLVIWWEREEGSVWKLWRVCGWVWARLSNGRQGGWMHEGTGSLRSKIDSVLTD